ncbi:MAG: transporter, partial [Planctomycetota bacterium]
MDLSTMLPLGVAGLCAGFIDAIAGGGGLISLPALLWAGLPPHLALGTNKLQSAAGTTMAVHRYHVARLID